MFGEQRALNYIRFSTPEESEKEVNIFKKQVNIMKKTVTNIVGINLTILIIILNVNCLNTRREAVGKFKKQDLTTYCLKETLFKYKSHIKSKQWRKI